MQKRGIITFVMDINADVAELADARDLKSRGKKFPCRFDPGSSPAWPSDQSRDLSTIWHRFL